MEVLLPSEIARLVYGYLIDEKCEAAAQLFLETSQHLKECYAAHQKGRKFSTRVVGLCLVDILNYFCDAVCMIKNYKEKKELSNRELSRDQEEYHALYTEVSNVLQELGHVLLVAEDFEKNNQKTVFVRISIPPRKKISSNNGSEKKDTGEEKETSEKEKEKKKDTDEDFGTPTVAKNVSSALDDFDLNMLQTLLDNTALHERIAENINKAIDSTGEVIPCKTNEKKIVEAVLHSTETDPVFEELLQMLAVPRAEEGATPEDTDKENGDPSARKHPTDTAESQEQETRLRLEADNNMAIEGILAGNKRAQEQEKGISQPANIPISQVTGVSSSVPIILNPQGSVIMAPITSTPLQPLKTANITAVSPPGPVSPILTNQRVLIPAQSMPRGTSGMTRGKRRRLLLPKMDMLGQHINSSQQIYQIEVHSEGSMKPTFLHAVTSTSLSESIKVPGPRTRGGRKIRGGTRGVKAIVPQVTQLKDDSINVVFVEGKSPMKTRLRSSNARKMGSHSNSTMKNLSKLTSIRESSEERIDEIEKTNSADSQPPASETSGKLCPITESVGLPNLQDEAQNRSPDDVEVAISSSNSVDPESLNKEAECCIDKDSQESDKSRECPPLSPGISPEFTKASGSSETAPRTSKIDPVSSENSPGHSEAALASSNNVEDSAQLKEVSASDSYPIASRISNPEDAGKDASDEGTPIQQDSVKKCKKRISLSTPRRGSHIRTLDFNTPEKPLEIRKSLTSPKTYSKTFTNTLSLDKAKREILKSPEINNKGEKKEKAINVGNEKLSTDGKFGKKSSKKSDWDAELRKFVDIPTSVGLRRKTAPKRTTKKNPKKKPLKKTSPKKNKKGNSSKNGDPKSTGSHEDLTKQTENKEVLSEEEVASNSSVRIRPFKVASVSDDIVINEENPPGSEPLQSTQPSEAYLQSTGLNVFSLQANNSDAEPSHINQSEKNSNQNQSMNILDDSSLTSSLRIPDSAPFTSNYLATPIKETITLMSDLGEITPNTKVLLGHLSANFSPNSNSQSYSALESILISEGARLEKEKFSDKVLPDITKLTDSSEVVTKSQSPTQVTKSKVSEEARRHIPVECVSKISIPQTPAKILMPQAPLGFLLETTPISKANQEIPVEMTPLSKALRSSTKVLSTTLVTPTLPATPKSRDDKSPERTNSIIDVSDKSDIENVLNKESCENENEVLSNSSSSGITGDITKITQTLPDEEQRDGSLSEKSSKGADLMNIPKKNVFCITPRVKLAPKEVKTSGSFKTKQKFPAKKNVRCISSSSESSSAAVEAEIQNVKSVLAGSVLHSFENVLSSNSLSADDPKKFDSAKQKSKKSNAQKEMNKPSKTPQKISPGKKRTPSDLALLKEEQKVLKECLKKVNSNALFGFLSSDSSDTSIDHKIEKTADKSIIDSPSKQPKISSSLTKKKGIPCTSKAKKNKEPSKNKIKSSKPELVSARETLRKITSVSMLNSSSSSEEDGLSAEEIHSGIHFLLNSSVNIPMESKKGAPTAYFSKCNDINSNLQNSSYFGSKKQDSPKKAEKTTKEIFKPILRDREESCESFPTLYLSEESNMSAVSDNHTAKSIRFRKSPSAGSDLSLARKLAISSSSGAPSLLRSNLERTSFSKQVTVFQKPEEPEPMPSQPFPSNQTGSSSCDVKEFRDSFETVVHNTLDNTENPVISVQESLALKEYLNNYTFSFTIDGDGRDDLMTKTLKTSPFLPIFEMNMQPKSKLPVISDRIRVPPPVCSKTPGPVLSKTPVTSTIQERISSPPSKKPGRNESPLSNRTDGRRSPRRLEKQRGPVYPKTARGESSPTSLGERGKSPILVTERLQSSSSRERQRKRYRSHSNSDDERRKRSRYPISDRRDHRGSWRSRFSDHRPRSHYEGGPWHRDNYGKHRGRRMEPDSKKWTRKRSEYPEQHQHHSKPYHVLEKRFNLNDSFRSSKSTDSERLMVDQSFKSSEPPESPLSGEFKSYNKSSRKSEYLEHEEGELSDSLELQGEHTEGEDPEAAREAKRQELIALMSDSNRAKMLKQVDVDRFLTMLHGAEKDDK